MGSPRALLVMLMQLLRQQASPAAVPSSSSDSKAGSSDGLDSQIVASGTQLSVCFSLDGSQNTGKALSFLAALGVS